MSTDEQSNGHGELPEDRAGVLANLPRTRPQRATARRAAARRTGSVRTGAAGPEDAAEATRADAPDASPAEAVAAAPAKRPAVRRPAKPAKASKPKTASRAGAEQTRPRKAAKPAAKRRVGAAGTGRAGSARTARRAISEPIPRQGYESEAERVSGSVQPPGPTELFGAATELLGEVAKAGLSGGERLLKGALSLLSR